MSIDYDRIRQLVKMVEKNRLSELTIEEDGLSVTIKAEEPVAAQFAAPLQSPVTEHAEMFEEAEEVEVPETPAVNEFLYEIASPMVGVFYRHPSPDSPSFVEPGDHVEVGQTIGLIEAMKVFSEVPTEVAGRVVSIPVENATLVQQGQVLIVIDTSETGVPAVE
jgi:acetyl-CoA carboxylase biotin carboxyl carrier protein